jgi:hypothetical protein
MKIIEPVLMTDAMLVASSLTEDEYPPWSAGATWAEGARCILGANHTVYQRLVAGVSAAAPNVDSVNWGRVGASNLWAMFDRAVGSVSVGSASLTVTIAPGLVQGLALLDVSANVVNVVMTNGGETVYSREINLNAGDGVVDWYTYFFAPVVLRRTVVLTDLPPFLGGQITITLTGASPVSVGTVAAGSVFEMGSTLFGMDMSFTDYSIKERDKYGVVTLAQGNYADRLVVPFTVKKALVSEMLRRAKLLRATPVVAIGDDFDAGIVYGLLKDTRVIARYETLCDCSTTVEGLV